MSRLADPYAALRVPSFRRFVGSLLTMTVAAQVQAVVVGWLVYQITRDPLALGLIGLAEVVPYVSVALIAGYIADRADRKRVTVIALGVLLASSVALFIFVLIDPSPSIVWPFYVIIGVCGLARSFLQVSRSALVAEVVPRELFPNAATWRSSTWQLGSVAGPALGGILFAAFGARVTFGLNIVLSLGALLAMIAVRHTPGNRAVAGVSVLRNLAEGVAFLKVNRVILAALSLDLIAVFFGGAVALMPIFAADILEVGPRGLGFLQGAPGAGAVLMAFILAHRPPVRAAGRSLLIAVSIFGVCMIGFALSRSFPLSVALLFVSGAADNVSAVIRSIMIQVLVPPEMLGRVSAVNAVFVGSSNELGAFESGVVARLIGVVPSVVFGGLMTLTVAGVAAWRVPVLRNLREIRSSADSATTPGVGPRTGAPSG
ncbi:MAG: MFS transporter [Gemmatimonadota bacterium]